eukprot:2379137-Rhodomonas_salina.1
MRLRRMGFQPYNRAAKVPAHCRTAAIYGCTAAIYGCTAAIYGCTAAIYGCTVAIYGCTVAIYGCITGRNHPQDTAPLRAVQ